MSKVSKTKVKEISNELVQSHRKANGIHLSDIHVFDIMVSDEVLKTDHPYSYGLSLRSNYNFDLTDKEQVQALLDFISKALQSHLNTMK